LFIRILDDSGILVPDADNLVRFEVTGQGRLVGVDNGLQTSHEPFISDQRTAFHGLCLAVIKSSEKAGRIVITARSDGLKESSIEIRTQKTGIL